MLYAIAMGQIITNTDVVTNDQPICKNKGRNESNELSSNNLRFFRNNLGLVCYTTYSCCSAFSTPAIYSCIFHSCIFHPCDLLLLFSPPHFQSPRPINNDVAIINQRTHKSVKTSVANESESPATAGYAEVDGVGRSRLCCYELLS